MSISLFSGTEITTSSLFSSMDVKGQLLSYSNLLFKTSCTKNISDLNVLFVQGNFTDFITSFYSQYNTLSIQLNQLKIIYSNDPIFIAILSIFENIFNNLNQGVIQYNNLQTLLLSLQKSEVKQRVLQSIDSVKAYLLDLQKQNSIFDTNINATTALLKPEYAKYISLYGIPRGGVFDIAKMAAIISEVNGPL